ncbi:MAG: thiamine phosphate synthase [Hyphomicrobiales bacterium]
MSDSRTECRLCLSAPSSPEGDFPALLVSALDADDVASLVLPAPAGSDEKLIARCVAAAQERGVATLIDGDIEAAKRLGADGVHIQADARAFAVARGLLGPSAIVGVHCGASRHDALAFGEKGADYVAFSAEPQALAELIGWWSQVVVVPCIAWDIASPGDARELASAGADFVSAAPAIWAAQDGPAKAVEAFNAAIEREGSPA